MQLSSCIEQIEKIARTPYQDILFINANNFEQFKEIRDHFAVGNMVNVADNMRDDLPQLEEIIDMIDNSKEIMFVEGVSAYARFLGQKTLRDVIRQLINSQLHNAVILLYQCEDILRELINKDLRCERQIFLVDGQNSALPVVTFVDAKIASVLSQPCCHGLSALIKIIESGKEEHYYVESRFSKSNFSESVYLLEEISSYFEIIRLDYLPVLSQVDKELVTDACWKHISQGCRKYGSFYGFFKDKIGDPANIDLFLANWSKYKPEDRALIFVLLKTSPGLSKNRCLKIAIEASKTIDELLIQVYKSILQFKYKDIDFWHNYDERKSLISAIGHNEHVANLFCGFIDDLGICALYYLTDLTKVERKQIIKLISKYHQNIKYNELLDVVKRTYKDLFEYLSPYDYGNDFLTKYFNSYKRYKVENNASEEFLKIVDKEGRERNYNLWLPTRSEKVRNLKKANSILYFVDALGVEYLSYIANRASEHGMMINATICHSNLPSITEYNKEFIDEFKSAGAEVVSDIKQLDEIKHSGTQEYNYSKSPLPSYLADELSVINDVIEKINSSLGVDYERAYIISDHGASRLAVIKRNETKWEMANKGKYCGRCCEVADGVIDEPNEYMTQENGFWVLANYDMIKGGRPGTVEVHGGATLEEVCVPIIEFTRLPENIRIDVTTPLIQIGFKIKPLLKFVSNTRLSNISIIVEGKQLKAVTNDDRKFSVELQGFRREKEYSFDVLSNNNPICKGLKFRLQAAGMSDNDLL